MHKTPAAHNKLTGNGRIAAKKKRPEKGRFLQ